MGASNLAATFPGNLKKPEVEKLFQQMRKESLRTEGCEYSGGFGMFEPDLDFRPKKFGSVREAQEWIWENHEKWDEALAVRATDKKDDGTTEEVWVVGGWAAE
jgi:hypothetical protein